MQVGKITSTTTQTNYSIDPPFTTLSPSMRNPEHATFMLAFSVNIDSQICPNSAISFQAFANQHSGPQNNRTATRSSLSV
jgi:hypothetical protein